MTAITGRQQAWLTERIEIVRRNRDAMNAAMRAVCEIHESGFWKFSHATFAQFCTNELGISASTGKVWIAATKALQSVRPPDQHILDEDKPAMPDGTPLRQAHALALDKAARETGVDPKLILDAAVKQAESNRPADDRGAPRMTAAIIKQSAAALSKEKREAETPDDRTLIEDQLKLWLTTLHQLHAAKSQIAMLSRGLGGRFLNVGACAETLDHCIALLKASSPYSPCVYCGGKPHAIEDCTACDGFGYSSKAAYQSATDAQKQRVEPYSGHL